MKKLFLSIVCLFYVAGCTSNNKTTSLDKSLKSVIDEYIKIHPMQILGNIKQQEGSRQFPHPVYHLYFDKVETDTIISIVLQPHFNPFELKTYKTDENESYFKMIETRGVYFYNKYPIAIFDNENYSINYFENDELVDVPDSLQPTFENVHIKFDCWNFSLKNGKLERIKTK